MFFADNIVPPDPRLTVVNDDSHLAEWERLLLWCGTEGMLSYDVETDGFNYFDGDRIIGFCFGYDARDGVGPRGVYFPIRHRTTEAQLDVDKTKSMVGRIIGDPRVTAVTHNGSFDRNFTWADGIPTACQWHDTLICAALLDENQPKDLETLCVAYGVDDNAHRAKKAVHLALTRECARRGVKKKDAPGFGWLPVGLIGPYGAIDGMNTLALAYRLLPQIDRGWAGIYDTERRLQSVLQRAEYVGQPINRTYLEDLRVRKERERDALSEEINRLAGVPVDVSKDDQIRELVYGRLRQPVDYYTKGGTKDAQDADKRKPAVDAVAIRSMYHRTGGRIFSAILDWRDRDKIVTTYTSSILRRVDPDGVLHGRFDQVGARTGRLSSRDPNLQNMPSSTEAGIRKAFTIPEGCVRVYMDFSQIELRVLAWCAREPTLTDAFVNGRDVHSETSMRMFGNVDKSVRRVAKVINFGTAYGMSALGVRDNLNKSADPSKGIPVVDDNEAQAYLDQWNALFPRVEQHKRELVSQMMREGWPPRFTNPFGRTRRIFEVAASGAKGRRGERQAIASEVQGTANELMKISMVRVEEEVLQPLRAQGIRADLVGNIHDELIIDVDRDHAIQVAEQAKRRMEDFPQFAPIPIIADGEWTATTWADKEDIWK